MITFEEYVQKHLAEAGYSFEDMELVGIGWMAKEKFGQCFPDSTKTEIASLAYKDSKVFDDMAAELSSLNYAIEAFGHDGVIEMEKVRVIAKDAIKRLVNYI
jgi:hypothetical protein